MLFENILLPGVVIPTACAAAVLLAAVLADRRRRSSTVGGGAAALGAALLSAHVAASGWPAWPPIDSTQRLFFVVALAAALGALRGWLREEGSPWWVRGGLVLLLLLGMLKTPLEHTWKGGEAVLWMALLFTAVLAAGRSLEADLTAPYGLAAALARLALPGGVAVLLGLSGTVRLAQLAGALACGVLVVEVAALRWRRRPWLPADAWVLAAALCGLLLGGYFYASLAALPAALGLLALLLPGLVARRRGAWRLVPLVPLAIALALATAAALGREDDPYGAYGRLEAPAVEVAGGNIGRRLA